MHFTPDPEVFIGITDKVVFEVMDRVILHSTYSEQPYSIVNSL